MESREVGTREIGAIPISIAGPAGVEQTEALRRGSSTAAMSGKEGEEKNRLVFTDDEKLFDLEDLLQASAEVLGKGTLGTSYKAVLEVGMIVAVKRLRDVDDSKQDEHRERIDRIGRLKHGNLVPLRAHYLDKEENLLVYDFMQNGSLHALLHDGSDEAALGWYERLRIAATAAKGLAFLHAQGMVHGNLKSANVLLTSNLEACLADYCLAHSLSFAPPAATPSPPPGYTAPEVTHPRSVHPKSDVFSFGVLLLELLTGRIPSSSSSSSSAPSSSLPAPAASSPSRSLDPIDLPRWVRSIVQEERTAEVFDPSLIRSGQPLHEEEMVHLLQVAMPCVAPSPDQRPSMADVVRMIDNIRRTTDDDKSSDS